MIKKIELLLSNVLETLSKLTDGQVQIEIRKA